MARFRSIHSRITAMILAASLSSATVGLMVNAVVSERRLRASMVEATTAQAQLSADYAVSALAFSDRDAAREGLAKLRGVPGIEFAALYDRDGQPFIDWEGNAPPAGAGATGAEFAGDALQVRVNADFRGEHFGTLHVRQSTAGLQAALRRELLASAALLLIMTLIAIGLAVPFARTISRPISQLAEVAGRISADGDYTRRVSAGGPAEVGELGRQFNAMLDAIQTHERARDLADRRSREKSQFLANMSHELRTPLNSVIGFSQILLERLTPKLEPREVKFLGNIQSSGQHLLGIVNDILDLSKVEAGHVELVREETRPAEVVESVAGLIGGMARRRDVRIETAIHGGLAPLWADPVKLKQILYNLLSNAIKFSPEGAVVKVSARELAEGAHGAVEFRVEDRGIGIAPADQARIFEAFQQVDSGAARQFEGTGLGLTLVRTFTLLHGGRVALESTPGTGSVFFVVIPRAEPPAAAAGAA